MDKLNLPPFNFAIKEFENGLHVYDTVRKKYIKLTPEEWVRQHFVHYLITEHRYPKSLFRLETGLRYNELLKRSDVLVYDRDGKPFVLAECKSAKTRLDEKVLRQAATYNYSLRPKFLIVTNGMEFLCTRLDSGQPEWLQSIPEFPE